MKKILLVLFLLLLSNQAWAVNWCDSSEGCWLLDYNEDPQRDSSPNNLTLSLYTESALTFISEAKFGGGYDFSPISVIERSNLVDIEGETYLTIVLYVKPDNVGIEPQIIGKGGWGKTFNSHFYDNGRVYFGQSGTDRTNTADNLVQVDSWQHLAFQFDGNNQEYIIFYEGVEAARSASALTTVQSSTSAFKIGGEVGSYNGSFDEVALFNTLLSSTDINDIMDNGLVQDTWIPKIMIF